MEAILTAEQATGRETPDASRGDRSKILQRLRNGIVVVIASAVIIGLAAAGIAGLKYRAEQAAVPEKHPPIAVATTPIVIQESYQTTTRYVGRIEPARQTDLAFELAGLVLKMDVDEGDTVRAGDVIATLDTQRLEAQRLQLEAQTRELQAERKLAEFTLERQSSLQEKGWSPQQREDEALASVSRLSAAIDRVAAQIELVEIDIRKSSLVAPYDGTIGARFVDEGTVTGAGAPVVTVLETGRPRARIGLPPEIAATLEPERLYRIHSPTKSFPARLIAGRPDLNTATGTVPVLFALEDVQDVPFREIVTLVVETEVEGRGAWLPLSALTEGNKGLWSVLVVDDTDQNARLKAESVELVHVDDERAYVRGSLRDGARVVTEGTHRVVPGQHIALSRE
jgi:RND family efflux transporter MFP subunit